MGYKIIIFPSVHYTLAGEQILKAEGIEHQVIPVPPYINEGCGLGIKTEELDIKKVFTLFAQQGVETENIISAIG